MPTLKQLQKVSVLTLLLNISCQKLSQDQVSGLWRLDELNIDGFDKPVDQLYLQILENGSFAVTRPAGDMVGTFELQNDVLRFHSVYQPWWNEAWNTQLIQGELRLRGTQTPHVTTFLKFTPVDHIPDFSEFERALMGEWALYRIRKSGDKTFPNQTYMTFTPRSYSLKVDHATYESGGLKIDPRHRKLIFEHHDTAWKAWFYGRELRLTNSELELEYSLRRE